METTLLISPFTMLGLRRMYSALTVLAPDEGYALMRRLSDLEEKTVVAHQIELLEQHARPRLELVPRLTRDYDIGELCNQYARYVLDLNFDTAFLLSYMNRLDVIDSGLVDLGNFVVLENAIATGRPIILTPFHIGPCYAGIPILASRVPQTTLYHSLPFDELRAAFVSHIDIEGIGVADPNVLLRSVSVLKKGRALSMFPELDPAGPGRLHVPVPFFGIEIKAPTGPAMLAQRFHALIVPWTFRRTGPARYRFSFAEPIDVAAGAENITAATARIFEILQRDLTDGEPGAWEIWTDFEQIISPEPVKLQRFAQ
jgi:lauroyl/myristoyl acyltransferase